MISAFLDFTDVWGTYLLFVVLQFLVMIVVKRSYDAAQRWLDEYFPDDLPIGAGAWVRHKIAELGLTSSISVLVPGEKDSKDPQAASYSPAGKRIWLGKTTFFKHDPTFWAVGAHELGHALMHLRHRFIAPLLLQSRLLEDQFSRMAIVFLLANIAFGADELTAIAYWLIIASLACNLLVLIDEGWASAIGALMLKRDARLNRRHWVGALAALTSAFCTYLGGLVAKLILLVEFDYLARLLAEQTRYQVGPPLDTWQLVVTATLSVFLGIVACLSLARLLWPRRLVDDDAGLVTVVRLVNGLH